MNEEKLRDLRDRINAGEVLHPGANAPRWKRGDRHECPLLGTLHVADLACVKYALDHQDLSFAGNCEKCGRVACSCPAVVPDPSPEVDLVNRPPHYTAYPVEVIELTEHLNFCRGNAVKYIARAGLKGGPEDELRDLRKARWYVEREIARLERGA